MKGTKHKSTKYEAGARNGFVWKVIGIGKHQGLKNKFIMMQTGPRTLTVIAAVDDRVHLRHPDRDPHKSLSSFASS